VYAILQEEDDDSDESDDEETDTLIMDVNDVPADEEIELEVEVETETTSELTPVPSSRSSSDPSAWALDPSTTPDPESVPASSSLPSLSSDRSVAKGTQSTPFKSIIATRRQKAAATTCEDIGITSSAVAHIQQLVTPPLSEDTASLIDTSSWSSKRITRSSLAPVETPTDKGKSGERASTPSVLSFKDKGKQEDRTKIKEESEARVLRTRPSLLPTPLDDTKTVSAKSEKPKGPDGKPLPTCVTCSNVLPVISVDLKVVWGLIEISPRGKGKKRDKQECPRYVFFLLLYGC
jgi:histone-lysine N-methyltransferase SUV420H